MAQKLRVFYRNSSNELVRAKAAASSQITLVNSECTSTPLHNDTISIDTKHVSFTIEQRHFTPCAPDRTNLLDDPTLIFLSDDAVLLASCREAPHCLFVYLRLITPSNDYSVQLLPHQGTGLAQVCRKQFRAVTYTSVNRFIAEIDTIDNSKVKVTVDGLVFCIDMNEPRVISRTLALAEQLVAEIEPVTHSSTPTPAPAASAAAAAPAPAPAAAPASVSTITSPMLTSLFSECNIALRNLLQVQSHMIQQIRDITKIIESETE